MWPVSRVSSLSFQRFCDWRHHGVMAWWVWLTGGLWKECSRNDGHVPAQGGAGPGGRKEEKHKGGTDAAMLRCPPSGSSPVSSLWQMTQLCRAASADVSSSGAEKQVRRGQECAMEFCVMSRLPHTTLYKTWSAVSCAKVTWLSISFLLKLNLQWQGRAGGYLWSRCDMCQQWDNKTIVCVYGTRVFIAYNCNVYHND